MRVQWTLRHKTVLKIKSVWLAPLTRKPFGGCLAQQGDKMKKLFIGLMTIIALVGCNLFPPFGSKDYVPAEYTSIKDVANPSQETKIELDDGAAIIIPANATNGEVTVIVERNPEKSKNLPPLGDDVVQLGDFYNFDISGGTLIDGVDLVLPFDESRVPQKDGMLVIAIPSENGWEFVPVEADGNKATFYTSNVGDPLIAWHFVPIDGRIDLSYKTKEELTVCDEHIQLDISPANGTIGTEIKITGQVSPVRKGIANWQENWDKLLKFKTAANVPVKLYFGSSYVGNGYGSKNVFDTITISTNEDGSFEAAYKIDREGYGVHITAKAQCDKWFGTMPVPSEGRIYFRLTQPTVVQPANPQPTEPPVVEQPTETPIPAEAVLLPDFVGQPIEDAIAWLEENGFKYTWIDGSSTYGLGTVFRQAPVGGQYKVPHRTVVVLYRTTEKIEDVYGCSNPILTPEEKANCGEHTYTVEGSMSGDKCYFKLEDGSHGNHYVKDSGLSFIFESNGVIYSNESNIPIFYTRINENIFEYKEGARFYTLKFTQKGFIAEWSFESCKSVREATIIR